MNLRVASQVVERLKSEDLRKLGDFKKIPEMQGFDGEYPTVQPKAKFCRFFAKNYKKAAVKHSVERSYFA